MSDSFARLTPAEAASLIPNAQIVAFSGFTAAGAAKVVSLAIAERARQSQTAGRPFDIRVLSRAH